MSYGRINGAEPLQPDPVGRAGAHHEVLPARTTKVAEGTLACPSCDAPVALTAGPVSPAEPLYCPFCAHAGAVREFLSLGAPTRPARVVVRVVYRRAVVEAGSS